MYRENIVKANDNNDFVECLKKAIEIMEGKKNE